MNPQLEEKITQKINEVKEKSEEIVKIMNSFNDMRNHPNSFAYGIAIGKLYNSFYYQCRRILKRDPTDQEFREFLDMIHRRKEEILDALRINLGRL